MNDDPWTCPWCAYQAPVPSIRDQHEKQCPNRPEENR